MRQDDPAHSRTTRRAVAVGAAGGAAAAACYQVVNSLWPTHHGVSLARVGRSCALTPPAMKGGRAASTGRLIRMFQTTLPLSCAIGRASGAAPRTSGRGPIALKMMQGVVAQVDHVDHPTLRHLDYSPCQNLPRGGRLRRNLKFAAHLPQMRPCGVERIADEARPLDIEGLPGMQRDHGHDAIVEVGRTSAPLHHKPYIMSAGLWAGNC